MNGGQRKQCPVLSFFYLSPLSLSLTLKLGLWLGSPSIRSVSLLHLARVRCVQKAMLAFLHGCWASELRPSCCSASAFPTEPPMQPLSSDHHEGGREGERGWAMWCSSTVQLHPCQAWDRQPGAMAAFLGGGLIAMLNGVMGNALLLDWSAPYTSMSICVKSQT